VTVGHSYNSEISLYKAKTFYYEFHSHVSINHLVTMQKVEKVSLQWEGFLNKSEHESEDYDKFVGAPL
jgi:hypothetical protein